MCEKCVVSYDHDVVAAYNAALQANDVKHGTPGRYRKGCRCGLCRTMQSRRSRAAYRKRVGPKTVATHCKRGHEYTPENTYRPPSGGRYCRECQKTRATPRKPCVVVDPETGIRCVKAIHRSGMCAMHHHREKMGHDLHAPLHKVGKPKATIHKPCRYSGAHSRCVSLWGSPAQYPCVDCGKAAEHWAYDGTDPEELCDQVRVSIMVYSRYPEFYKPLCRDCHGPHDASWRRTMRSQWDEFQKWKLAQTG